MVRLLEMFLFIYLFAQVAYDVIYCILGTRLRRKCKTTLSPECIAQACLPKFRNYYQSYLTLCLQSGFDFMVTLYEQTHDCLFLFYRYWVFRFYSERYVYETQLL